MKACAQPTGVVTLRGYEDSLDVIVADEIRNM